MILLTDIYLLSRVCSLVCFTENAIMRLIIVRGWVSLFNVATEYLVFISNSPLIVHHLFIVFKVPVGFCSTVEPHVIPSELFYSV